MKKYYKLLHKIKRRKTKWIGHILRTNCLLKHVIEGKIEGRIQEMGRLKELLDDLAKKRGYSKLKDEALDPTLWRTRFGKGYGLVVR
jgi:hypothetical protein